MLNSPEDELSNSERVQCLVSIKRSVDRMSGLIANLLDMASIEAGKLRIDETAVDFAAICRELKDALAPTAKSRQVDVRWEVPEGPFPVLADNQRIVQVMTNLISNAFKHTPEKGKIVVKVSLKEGCQSPFGIQTPTMEGCHEEGAAGPEKLILTEVTDDGDGISPEDQPRIFEQFYQVETSPAKREGLGLGLSICKEIIHSHQGEIGVSSEGPGKGSRFWFTLPLRNLKKTS
jgi:signal transduction histidine kinase